MDDIEVTEGIKETVPEKTLTQSQVNEIVKREKMAAEQKAKREMEALLSQQQTPAQNSNLDINSIEEKIAERVRLENERIQEEAYKRQLEEEQRIHNQHLENIGRQYQMKMSQGSGKYSDFEDVMKGFDLNAFPHVAFLATDLENTPDIMYELAKSPLKASALNDLATKSPDSAIRELKKLADSIALNAEALANEPKIPSPLSRHKSSPTAGGDSGKRTIADLKKMPWLRG